MSVIYFNGSSEDEQAKGGIINAGTMDMYAVNRNKPSQLIYIGGHFMDDAPTYNSTEGRILSVHRHVGGRNIIEEVALTEDLVKSVVFNLMLPNRVLSVTDRMYQTQKSCNYDVFFVPDTCDNACDVFYWLARDVVFGVKQFTSTILGFDENANPITNMRTLRISGNLVEYHGLQVKALTPATDSADLYGVDIAYETCEGCDCPYQTIVRVGDELAEVSRDGGATWTAITITALDVGEGDAILTSVVAEGGNFIVGYTDSYPTGTDGGIGVSVGGDAFTVPALSPASKGINKIVKAFGKILAFGTAGEAYTSCDGGFTWAGLVTGITADITHAVYDKDSGLLVIGGANNTLWTYDGSIFRNIGTSVTWPAGTSDVSSLASLGNGGIALGTADGLLAEHTDIAVASATNKFTTIRLVPSTNISAAAGDVYGTRLVWIETGSGAHGVYVRDPYFKMNAERIHNVATATVFRDAVAGAPLLGEGTNFYVFVGAGGVTYQVSSCNLCIKSNC